MSYFQHLSDNLGSTVEYAVVDVVEPARPELGRREKGEIVWTPFSAFVTVPGRWGIQRGDGTYPKTLGTEISLHTAQELEMGVLLRYEGQQYRLTGKQRQQMAGMGEVWAYTATSEAKGVA